MQHQQSQPTYPTPYMPTAHGYRNHAFEHTKDCPRSRPIGAYGMPLQARQESYLTHHPATQNQFSQGHIRQEPNLCRPGHLNYPTGQDYHNQYSYGPPPYCHPPLPQWSAEEEEMKYGPFSDGEAETLRRGTRQCKKTMRSRGAPHYATMSRAHELAAYKNQSSLESNDGHSIKYTSQPHLNGSISDYLGQRPPLPPSSDILTPLSIKTSITFPRQKPHEKSKPGVPSLKRQENVRISHDNASQNYPDLARHPLSYSVAPPPGSHSSNRYSLRSIPHGYQGQFPNQMSHSFVQNRQNSSDDGHFEYEHSRSSSVGDIQWGMNGNPDNRMATPDGFSSLPYDSVKLAVNGVKKRTVRSGAVKVDLSWADKSIRRPGSAPDLVAGDEAPHSHSSPGATSLRENKKGGSLKDRARSTSSESREPPLPKKTGVSPGTRKVAFAGIEDEESDSESEKQSRDSITSFDEDVWVKQPDPPKRPSDELVPTTGVVIAQAQPCTGFASSKLQQSKCNGVR